MADANKNAVIRRVYYDKDTGFGSIRNTYADARRILNTITYDDVKKFLEKQTVRQTKGYRSYNSYVAHDKLEEIQIDIADFTKSAKANNGYRYCFVAYDVFTKLAHAVPMKNKQRYENIRAMKEVIQVMGTPKQLYHDHEGAWRTPEWATLMRENNIYDIITATHPPFAERMVQTIKNMVHQQLRGTKTELEKWTEVLPRILKKYNNTEHTTTGIKPNDAIDDDKKVDVWLGIKKHSQFDRKYEPLNVGDRVRVYITKDITKKAYKPAWSGAVYNVTAVHREHNQYSVNNQAGRRYNRNELLKIHGTETKDPPRYRLRGRQPPPPPAG